MTQTEASSKQRKPLSRERVLQGAVKLADRDGLDAVTMRNLAESLGVEAMSLYYHVENKSALLDGVADTVIQEILEGVEDLDGPAPDDDWKTALRMRILAAREVLLRHKWAPQLIEQQNVMSPNIIRYHEGILEIFRKGGFSYDLAHHAMHTLGSRAIGFAQELFQPDTGEEEAPVEIMEEMALQFPYIVEMLSEIAHDDPDSTIGWCDDQNEFEFGLDILLDGLEARRRTE